MHGLDAPYADDFGVDGSGCAAFDDHDASAFMVTLGDDGEVCGHG